MSHNIQLSTANIVELFLLNGISLTVTIGDCFVHCKVFTMGGRKS